jgi:predicted metal-binding membrane protein
LVPLKQVWLEHCREPALYLSHGWRPGLGGAFRLGLHLGTVCAACCCALMLIPIVLGVMNLAVMVAIANIIATEQLWKGGLLFSRLLR